MRKEEGGEEMRTWGGEMALGFQFFDTSVERWQRLRGKEE